MQSFVPRREGRVLVLDDDPAMRWTIQLILEERVDVMAVDTIAAAWAAIAREPPDVVVADHDLGDQGTGVEFLDELVRRTPATGRILLTGHAQSPQVRRLSARSCEDGLTLVLYKPVDPGELLRWVLDGVAMARLVRACSSRILV